MRCNVGDVTFECVEAYLLAIYVSNIKRVENVRNPMRYIM
jgi:hypothetical protein